MKHIRVVRGPVSRVLLCLPVRDRSGQASPLCPRVGLLIRVGATAILSSDRGVAVLVNSSEVWPSRSLGGRGRRPL